MGTELYRDPVFDGATDPMVIFNRVERTWWMLYTSRRTTAPGAGVAWDGGYYHIYVSYIRDVAQAWAGHERHILHCTSTDMAQWTPRGKVCLSSDYVIDACIFERPGGGYRMWYKDGADRSSTWVVKSASEWDRRRSVILAAELEDKGARCTTGARLTPPSTSGSRTVWSR
jgi:hypothetical protein